MKTKLALTAFAAAIAVAHDARARADRQRSLQRQEARHAGARLVGSIVSTRVLTWTDRRSKESEVRSAKEQPRIDRINLAPGLFVVVQHVAKRTTWRKL
jgi:hypothetical protein